jgi:hypothetical protein
MYYDAQGILSYKRLYNLVVGVRGHGKTYNLTKRCIDIGLQQKRVSFCVLVRYKEDYVAIKDGWWSIVEHLYPDYIFETSKKVIYAKNNHEKFPIGEFIILREYARVKRKPRPYVRYIFFDEFLNEDNDYLNGEIDKFLNICDSIIRNRDNCRVFLVSNTISIINPYFDYFNIRKMPDVRFSRCEHDSILEFTDSEDFVKYREQTKFGSSIKDTNYGKFALQGEFMLDDTTNVVPNPKGRKNLMFNISLDGMLIAVSNFNNLLYFEQSNDYSRVAYTPYVSDAQTNGAIFVDKNFTYFNTIYKRFINNQVMYQTLKIKNAIIELVRYKMGNRHK